MHQQKHIKRVTLDITNKCNLRCIMCPQHRMKENKFDMPLEVYEKIALGALPYTEELFFSCAYEPLMSGIFEQILDMTRPIKIPQIVIISNATLLNKNNIARIIESNVTTLILSMDGARKETYERIRQGAHFESILENIALFNAIKKEKHALKPDINMAFTLMTSNIEEIPLLVELARKLEINNINIKPLQVHTADMQKEALSDCDAALIRTNVQAALSLARTCGILVRITPELARFLPQESEPDSSRVPCGEHVPARKRCIEPFPSVYIRPDGDVFPCTIWKGEPLGNLHRQSFKAIWDSQPFRTLRAELESGDFSEQCTRCCYLI